MRIELPQLKIVLEEVAAPANLLAVLGNAKVPVARSCGGDGVCGTCRLKIVGEKIPPRSELEKRLEKKQGSSEDERFACLIEVPDVESTWILSTLYW